MKFSEQSEAWFEWLRTRKRSPLKPGSLATYHSYLARIVPRLGAEELSTFGNAGMKEFVSYLATEDLGPKSIVEHVSVVKQIVASAVDADGNELFPRRWNKDFIDAPLVDKAKQETPVATQAQVQRAVRESSDKYSAFYALLAGTGLRFGEARALRIGDDGIHTAWDAGNRLVSVRTALWRGIEQSPKTAAAVREIDISKSLNNYLMDFCSSRANGLVRSTGEFMFLNDAGKPMHDSTVRKFSLDKFNIGGAHAFRRFRITHLREHGVPEDIIRFWVGHAGSGITDRYSKLAQNVELRKQWAERAGLGFGLPKRRGHAEEPVSENVVRGDVLVEDAAISTAGVPTSL